MRQTDSRGFNTYYDVDDETSRNMTVTDRCGNKTSYQYDASGRTTKVTSRDSNGTALAHVDYGYDINDNLIGITRGDSMGYDLSYNTFNRLESIGVHGMPTPLVAYNYKEGSGRLKEIAYANGDVMHVSYNRFGHPILEYWTDACNCTTAYYRYIYDNSGNLARSVDFIHQVEYTYTYEEGKIVRSTVNDVEVSAYDTVLSRTFKNSILYFYDTEGRLERTMISDDQGELVTYFNTYDDDGNVTTTAYLDGNNSATMSLSKDGLDRKIFDTVRFNNGAITRNFFYHSGAVTQEHIANNKVCGTATTNLVSKIQFSNGRTIQYWYDGEERITKVLDSYEGETLYTYDALGQLTSETKNACPECNDGVTVNVSYDNYGNILNKGNHTYGYDNVLWKDRLTSFDGQSITYDEQGNPINYLGHTLTWEKGRQLKSFDNFQYTYNANGIRISKTIDNIRHDYVVDGGRILKETWEDNVILPIYNNFDEVVGIHYNCKPYYFFKNLQGDVIGISDINGKAVVAYTYDAWGVCSVLHDHSDFGLSNINPYRYRSYYYDSETGMYYLQSRYYNPVVGRFINADEMLYVITSADILQYNSISYCCNDAVNMVDLEGFYPFDLFRTPDAAVKDFAYNYYNVSWYIRREISSIVYTVDTRRGTRYSYTPYVIGNFHDSIIMQGEHWIPKEGRFFAGVHTHAAVSLTSFSPQDRSWSKKHKSVLYGVFPDKTIEKIAKIVYPNPKKPARWLTIPVAEKMSFKKLDRDVTCRLTRRYKSSWKSHKGVYCPCTLEVNFGTQL